MREQRVHAGQSFRSAGLRVRDQGPKGDLRRGAHGLEFGTLGLHAQSLGAHAKHIHEARLPDCEAAQQALLGVREQGILGVQSLDNAPGPDRLHERPQERRCKPARRGLQQCLHLLDLHVGPRAFCPPTSSGTHFASKLKP